MSHPETIAFFTALAIYGTLSAALAPGLLPARFFRLPAAAALIAQGAGIGIRWSLAGHPPILGTFEECLAASWTLCLFGILGDKKGDYARIVIPFAFLTFLYGFMFNAEARPLVISEQSYWVYFHALFAWVSYGFYAISFLASAYLLVEARRGATGGQTTNGQSTWADPNGWLLYGFTAQTIMFALGSYYSSRLHGNWWLWDPVEYLFVVSWFLYAVAIHGRIFFGWTRRRVAVWVIAAFAGTMLLYWALIYFPWATYHVFDPEIKAHTFY